jgi:hypothetical protein
MNNNFNIIYEQCLQGIGSGKTLEDLVKKHKVSIERLQTELKKGISVEKEHTKDENAAKKIAMDHLTEDPIYYTKLAKMERNDK